MDFINVKVSKEALLGRGGSAKRKPTIFVAYRMSNPSSITFRSEFAAALREHGDVDIVDGHVDDGIPWAEEIRRRIKRAKLVVADVTGPSRDVVFEAGVASNKPLLPVVHKDSDRDDLPDWITAWQIRAYGGAGSARIADTAWNRLAVSNLRGGNRPPPIPGRIVWLQSRDSEWADTAFDRFRLLARERDLTIDRVYPEDLTSNQDLRQHLMAWLMIGCADGGQQDYAIHYFAGDIVARPDSGSGKGAGEKIRRAMIVLSPDVQTRQLAVANSVTRAPSQLIASCTEDGFAALAHKHLDRYRSWLLKDQDG